DLNVWMKLNRGFAAGYSRIVVAIEKMKRNLCRWQQRPERVNLSRLFERIKRQFETADARVEYSKADIREGEARLFLYCLPKLRSRLFEFAFEQMESGSAMRAQFGSQAAQCDGAFVRFEKEPVHFPGHSHAVSAEQEIGHAKALVSAVVGAVFQSG